MSRFYGSLCIITVIKLVQEPSAFRSDVWQLCLLGVESDINLDGATYTCDDV